MLFMTRLPRQLPISYALIENAHFFESFIYFQRSFLLLLLLWLLFTIYTYFIYIQKYLISILKTVQNPNPTDYQQTH